MNIFIMPKKKLDKAIIESESEQSIQGNSKESNRHVRFTKSDFKVKEHSESDANTSRVFTSYLASTHNDRVGDILSVNALEQMRDLINNESKAGDQHGSYRAISISHDWIKENNPDLDVAAMMKPTAKIVDMEDGHKGLLVDFELNEFYKGEMTVDELEYRIKNGYFAGLSIEYDTDPMLCSSVYVDGMEYRYIEELTEFGGGGFARPRKIANPHAVMMKEILDEVELVKRKMAKKKNQKEEATLDAKESESLDSKVEELMPSTDNAEAVEETVEAKEETKEEETSEVTAEEQSTETEEVKEEAEAEEVAEEPKAEESEEELEQKETKAKKATSNSKISLTAKEIMENKELMAEIEKNINVKTKVLNTKEEKMENTPLSVKEMNECLAQPKFDSFKYKEAASRYFEENNSWIDAQIKTVGVPLNTTMQVKCDGTKLRVSGNLQVKDTLNTSTNPSTYTQSGAEFADVYLPGIIDTFNQQTNLWGNLQKRDHMEGGFKYGWRIKTEQQSSLSVDPDDSSVNKIAVAKLKLQTDIKEYRLGVSVSDYTLHHSRASMGDLFRVEVESVTRDLMKDINGDLFTEQVDSGNQILGLEAVADSAGNTTLYGLTRTAANRLAPDSATDTYQAIGGALTTAKLREAARKVEVEGASRGNLRYVVNPTQRDNMYELEDSKLRYNVKPELGFDGGFSYDGIPVIVDSDCQTDAVFVVDMESYYIVMSRAPQLIGLAKVGAAEEAYISTYIAAIYEQPRRIHMLDTLS